MGLGIGGRLKGNTTWWLILLAQKQLRPKEQHRISSQAQRQLEEQNDSFEKLGRELANKTAIGAKLRESERGLEVSGRGLACIACEALSCCHRTRTGHS